ncbi:helix-turn-helix transcriptional regulator [Saccharothrix obliqua]|uniref:helix-turn-helix transcriptional regulator n=1 Tax=Saccharothrix obliqua TaxID=2861747 RepID=UPI001C5E4B30|nr:AraC family transcriptional regulator [Saccharothrix obliqua]MBW4721436.1 AraC family transcriptional regulator [Saccharothrix obliqua]
MTGRRLVSRVHEDDVTRVVRHMRADPAAPHRLADLAALATLSPSHFHRTFHRVTTTTPARYLTAVRMTVAKRLLAETDLTVTVVCARVGYASLGTFTTQFTRLVGTSPGAYRRAVDRVGGLRMGELLDSVEVPARSAAVWGTVLGGPARPAVLFTGLFGADLPQGRPVGCALVPVADRGSRVELGSPADGDYRAFTVCLDGGTTVVRALCGESQDHEGWGRAEVRVWRGAQLGLPFVVRLRDARPYDPPVVPAVPLLFALHRHKG